MTKLEVIQLAEWNLSRAQVEEQIGNNQVQAGNRQMGELRLFRAECHRRTADGLMTLADQFMLDD